MKFIPVIALFLLYAVQCVKAQSLTEKSYKDSVQGNAPVAAMIAPPAQTLTNSSMSISEREMFYEMYIPSIIGKTGMAPADFENFGFSFGDDKANFSSGLKKFDDKKSIGLQITAEAPNGSSTLFQPGAKTYDLGMTLKYTYKTNGTTWYVANSGRLPGTPPVISSQRSCWWNVSYSSNFQSLNVFNTDTTFTTQREHVYELLVSFNGVFNSLFIPKYIARRITWSAGLGFTRFTNYRSLDQITMHKGSYYPEKGVFSELDNTEGRKGPLKITSGAIFRGAVFIPVTNPFNYTNVYIGGTTNYYGVFKSNYIFNSNVGIYFSKRHADVQKNQLVEDFSVGLIADFKNLQQAGITDYSKKNFKVLLSAQIPLRFD